MEMRFINPTTRVGLKMQQTIYVTISARESHGGNNKEPLAGCKNLMSQLSIDLAEILQTHFT